MLGAARAYAQANQATLITPFILAGAMAPVTAAGVCAQTLAEALGGHGLRPARPAGRPGGLRVVRELDVDAVGRADVRHPGAGPRPLRDGRPRPAAWRARSAPAASLCASKVPDAQAAYESAATLQPTVLGGVNFVLHAAGWLEGGLAMGYEKFILDADQCGMMGVFVNGVDLSENGQALDAIRANGPGQHFLGTAHTLANFETAFYRSEVADNNSYEQWLEEGSLDAAQRANAIWKRMLAEYEAPGRSIPRIDEALRDFVAKRKASFPDSDT